jgi:hypothetical protein
MATNIRNAQAFPGLGRPADQSLWRRFVAIFNRFSVAKSGDIESDPNIPQAQGASDRELRMIARAGKTYPEDRLRGEMLVNLYSNHLHS